jgi:hypothetical protein
MAQINQLSALTSVSAGDQLPVYSQSNGDARRLSISALLTYFQQTFASPTVATNVYTPSTGFNITVPTPVAQAQWMLLQPAGTLASGTITLPLNTGVPDGTELLVSTTQQITSLAFALNGATAAFGAPSSLAAGASVRLRFYLSTNSWYTIVTDGSQIGAASGLSVTTSGSQLINGTGKQGYATGSGGTITQGSGSGKATAVTLNKSNGSITLDGAALNAATTVSFSLTNSIIEAGDILAMNHISGGTAGAYTLNAQCGAGSATISVRNVTAGSLSEAIVIRFAVIKAVSA